MGTLSGRIALPDGSVLNGRIEFGARIDSITQAETGGDLILPGLIDLQVNGSHGHDVMSGSPGALGAISEKLAREGTTAWLPTAVTAPLERIEAVNAAVCATSQQPREREAAILGMHLEGPFISPLRLGAHPRLNLLPRGEALERVLALGRLKIVTMAPELEGALDAIKMLTAAGTAVSIGHTDATMEQANAGISAGARMFTHLFNAMRPLNHRDPGVIAAALNSKAAIPAIIPDGVHVHPEVIRLVYATRRAFGMILTTDKVSLAGAQPGSSIPVAGTHARVVSGAARLGNGTIAGSIISMLDGVRMMVDRLGVSLGEAAVMASTNPARMLGAGDRGRLQPGARADMILLSPELELKAVFVAGNELT